MPTICDEYEIQIEPAYGSRCSVMEYLADDSRVSERGKYYTRKSPPESYAIRKASKKDIDTTSIIFLSSNLNRILGAVESSKDFLRSDFEALAAKWQKETSFHSAPVIKFRHPAYKTIIAMGKDVLPLIFKQLEQGSKIWSHALKEISGVNPALQTDNPTAATKAWLAWWKQNNAK